MSAESSLKKGYIDHTHCSEAASSFQVTSISWGNVFLAGSAIHSSINCTLNINYLSGTLVEPRSGWFCGQGHSDSQMDQLSCGPNIRDNSFKPGQAGSHLEKVLGQQVHLFIVHKKTKQNKTKHTRKLIGWISSKSFVKRNQHNITSLCFCQRY